ncbi:MAG: ankyrin repeat domain-containing protein [Proteobacteria bacterium]|nr:ankyrin repeat domain-containing protein [Pseudomonadota bacterium]
MKNKHTFIAFAALAISLTLFACNKPIAEVEPSSPDTTQKQAEKKTAVLHEDERILELPNVQTLKSLIAEGADVNTKDITGGTLLFDIEDYYDEETGTGYAKALEIVNILLDAGLDINIKNNEGKTALFEIAMFGDGAEPIVKALLEHGADVTIKANDGSTVLFAAVDTEYSSCNPKIIKMLIEAGADTKARNKDGKNYLEAADEECRYDIYEILVN